MRRFLEAAQLMSVIERWNNKPNLLSETVAAHSFLVAAIGWGLAVDASEGGRACDVDEVLKRSVAHDLHEVVTGDILAPTKRVGRTIRKAVQDLERRAGQEIVDLLPEPVRQDLIGYVIQPVDDSLEGHVVGTADLFAAFLKAWLEVEMGNGFHLSNLKRIRAMLRDVGLESVPSLMLDMEGQPEPGEGEPSLAAFLRHLFTLYYVKRWNNLPGLAQKSVAAHAHLVTVIAWVLALMEMAEHGRDVNIPDILRRALLVEAPKAITGDILYHSKYASKSMERGVQRARSLAARQLADSLPPSLRPRFEPYLMPLAGENEKIVEEASLLAAYLETTMEIRLGNTYFVPVRRDLRDRLSDPFPTTRALLLDLEAGGD